MNPILKSREYHRAYQKWDSLLLAGKVDEIMITPGEKSDVCFMLTLKKKPKNNNVRILQALEALPACSATLNDVRKDYDGKNRV